MAATVRHLLDLGNIRNILRATREIENIKMMGQDSRLKWIREKTVFYSFLCKILIASNKINRTNIYPYMSK